MTKHCQRLTQGLIAAVLAIDESPIVITEIWFGDSNASSSCMSCRFV